MKAVKTLEKIEEMLVADQGAEFRVRSGQVLPHIGDAYSGDTFPYRSHLGFSMIGNDCPRSIWYSFRWATKPSFEGRMLRLFNRGHLEEGRFIALLLMIGCQVYQQDSNGNQFRVSHCNGHAGGSGDGVVLNIPDLPSGIPCLTEFKTHGEKSFNKLKKSDVFSSKKVHYVQCQMYMGKMGIFYTLYCAVNKNTDEIYMEIIEFDQATYDRYLIRCEELVESSKPPQRSFESKTYFVCRYCEHNDVCWNLKNPEVNCRTCSSHELQDEGKWFCKKHSRVLSKTEQLEACPSYYNDWFKNL